MQTSGSTILQKEDILATLREHKAFIEKTYDVEKIGLFGSFANNTQTTQSDIDIYVEFKRKTFRNIAGLWVYLEKLYQRKIDLLHKHKQSQGAIFEKIQKEVIYG
ncbi:nucleotidyltransferase family protein [Sulfurospirillum deleyianum]|uniref:DNA polymerase beta domain protein region n=1 Tax=Sulfurospirillum deleyianum (strain ATCC 51133 / DSM 6946 / 5175) TaxID=525898 RepID=D1B364_SULD5|nr:nucleotidyltransferase domain-containing protein [Sulfurospirillum deleyianum]ACZ12534.1 DNA polymerase beta domain protein region [Sulfurospirillum deleyianum DSM 6946]